MSDYELSEHERHSNYHNPLATVWNWPDPDHHYPPSDNDDDDDPSAAAAAAVAAAAAAATAAASEAGDSSIISIEERAREHSMLPVEQRVLLPVDELKEEMLVQNRKAILHLAEFDDMRSEGLREALSSAAREPEDNVIITPDWMDHLKTMEKDVVRELYKVIFAANNLKIALIAQGFGVDRHGNKIYDGHRLGYEGGETGWRTVMVRNAARLKRLHRHSLRNLTNSRIIGPPTREDTEGWERNLLYTAPGGGRNRKKKTVRKRKRKSRRKKKTRRKKKSRRRKRRK